MVRRRTNLIDLLNFMTSDQLQQQLNETWHQLQSADDAHDAIWGEPFDGYTVKIPDIEAVINKPDYTNPEGMVRRLRDILQNDKEHQQPGEKA